ncbi:MAG: hypothetical protein HZB10_02395 [Candidatus Yonathbacteria bacterium]|nr:hypothetical protein [Candidatus Yonathbacteria bacterium]
MKRSIEKGELIELPGKMVEPPYIQLTNISVSDIKEGEPVNDEVLIKLKCTSCNSEIKLSLDTYHWNGGVEVISDR